MVLTNYWIFIWLQLLIITKSINSIHSNHYILLLFLLLPLQCPLSNSNLIILNLLIPPHLPFFSFHTLYCIQNKYVVFQYPAFRHKCHLLWWITSQFLYSLFQSPYCWISVDTYWKCWSQSLLYRLIWLLLSFMQLYRCLWLIFRWFRLWISFLFFILSFIFIFPFPFPFIWLSWSTLHHISNSLFFY